MTEQVKPNRQYVGTPAQELAHREALERAAEWIAKRKAAKLPINPFSDNISKTKREKSE